MYKEKRFRGPVIIFACSVVMFCNLACCGIMTVMLPHFVTTLNTSLTAVISTSSVGTIFGFVANMTTARMIKRFKAKTTMLLGILATVIFTVMNAYCTQLWMLYVSNVVSGFTLGWCTQVTCASIISAWYIKKRATMISIVFGISAFGSALFQFLAGQLLGMVGQKGTYLILGLTTGILTSLVALICIKNTPEEVGQKPYGWDAKDEPEVKYSTTQTEGGISIHEAYKSAAFPMTIIAVACASMCLTGFISIASTFWQQNGVEAATSATYVSLITFIGGIITIIAGMIADKFGLKIYVTLIFTAYAISVLSALLWSENHLFGLLMITVVFNGMSKPIQSVSSVLSKPLFGAIASDAVNSKLMAAFYVGTAAITLISGPIVDLTHSYTPLWILLIFLAIVSTILILLAIYLSPMKKYQQSKSM